MALEELGNIGELIAALGVVVSLLFVGVQLRRSSQYAGFAQTEARAAATREWQLLLVRDDALASLWRRGCKDPGTLDTDERFKFGLLFNELFFGWERTWIQSRALGDAGSIETVRILLGELATHQPGIVQWWARVRHRFDAGFRSFVEECFAAP